MNIQRQDNDIAYVCGQLHVVRALEVAAAGNHPIALIGAPGAGKTMLARSLLTLLPAGTAFHEMQPEEDVPDEGALFLRDMHLWTVRDLTRLWTTSSAAHIIATIEPCSCGYHGHPFHYCPCSAKMILHHQKKYAPFLASFDIQIQMHAPRHDELLDTRLHESSEQIRHRVEKVRQIQERRGSYNAALTTIIQAHQNLDQMAETMLRAAMKHFHMTPHTVVQALRLARTIADLRGEEQITGNPVAEAIHYCSRLRG